MNQWDYVKGRERAVARLMAQPADVQRGRRWRWLSWGWAAGGVYLIGLVEGGPIQFIGGMMVALALDCSYKAGRNRG